MVLFSIPIIPANYSWLLTVLCLIMKILAFGASSSSSSINQKFAVFAAHQIEDAEVTILDLNDFEMPIFSMDREIATGIPELAKDFKQHIANADGVIISLAEHNSSYTAAFKNILDWISRLEGKIWLNKPFFLMATSPGGRGGQTALGQATGTFPHQGGEVIAQFSLPFFSKNFSANEGIVDNDLKNVFTNQLNAFISNLTS